MLRKLIIVYWLSVLWFCGLVKFVEMLIVVFFGRLFLNFSFWFVSIVICIVLWVMILFRIMFLEKSLLEFMLVIIDVLFEMMVRKLLWNVGYLWNFIGMLDWILIVWVILVLYFDGWFSLLIVRNGGMCVIGMIKVFWVVVCV